MYAQFSQSHLVKSILFLLCFWHPCQRSVHYRSVDLFLGSQSCSNWSICLFLCQYHTVIITVALQYILKSGSVMLTALFFLLMINLAIQVLFWFYMHFRIVFSISVKNSFGNFIVCIEVIDHFGQYGHFNNINSSYQSLYF